VKIEKTVEIERNQRNVLVAQRRIIFLPFFCISMLPNFYYPTSILNNHSNNLMIMSGGLFQSRTFSN
jgi:hypothetical protein